MSRTEIKAVHELGQRQCRGKLGELGRLQAYGSQIKPRTRSFGILGHEYGYKQQQQERYVDDIGV